MQFTARASSSLGRSLTQFAVAALVLCPVELGLSQELRPIQANDLYRLRSASDIALSPDGSRVAFVVTQIDSATNSYRSHIWVAASDGGAVKQYTRGDVRDRGPVWSPGGDDIAFTSSRRSGDGSQIYILPAAGGEPWQLTDMEHGASNPIWAPDGRSLLFTSTLATHELEAHEVQAKWASTSVALGSNGANSGAAAPGDTAMFGSMDAIRNWLAGNARDGEPAVITRLRFQGERNLDPIERWRHVYRVELEASNPVRLTEGPFNYRSPSFSKDGDRIALTAAISDAVHPDFLFKSDLYILDIGSGELTKVDVPRRSVENAAWSPAGSHIVFSARDTAEITAANRELGLVELDEAGASEVQWLARSLDRSVRSYRWAPDGRSVYFTAGVHGTVPIYRVDIRNGQTRQIVSGERGVLSFDLTQRRLAYAITEPANPSEVYSANASGDDERRLTPLNSEWLAGVQIQPHSGFWYQSFDGQRVQAWTIDPIGFQEGERYPLALEIHGGPHSMWGPGETTMWHEFQLLAANGYMVLYTNPRGSDGYGLDFKLSIQRDWGDGPMNDVLTAVDTAVARGSVDASRLVVTGGSYAGYLTAYIIGNDHRFKAAVAQRGVYDLAVFFGEGNAWRLVPYEFDAYPWEDPEILREESPITYAHKIRTPFLIMHSDRDLRTGVSQSKMLYRTLKVQNKPVEYVRYPREGHNLSRSGEPTLRIDRLLRIVEFFDRYVRAPE